MAAAIGRSPVGFIERDETMEVAVVREVEEEAGVVARVKGLMGMRSRTDEYNSTYVIFLLEYVSGEPRPTGLRPTAPNGLAWTT